MSAINIFNIFFDLFSQTKPNKQNIKEGSYYKRRKPYESKIEIDDFKNKSLEEIYNFIRCLSDPYPNAYLEDSEGNRLYFKEVDYKKNSKN